jgi:hypothetical protein
MQLLKIIDLDGIKHLVNTAHIVELITKKKHHGDEKESTCVVLTTRPGGNVNGEIWTEMEVRYILAHNYVRKPA